MHINETYEQRLDHWIRDLREGQRFTRPREFGHGRHGDKWWFSSDYTGIAPVATGQEIIEVVEIIQSRTKGKIALHRRWIVDPDGVEMTKLSWVPKRSRVRMGVESALRGALNGNGWRDAATMTKAKREVTKLTVVK
jgi:hypothetical protein